MTPRGWRLLRYRPRVYHRDLAHAVVQEPVTFHHVYGPTDSTRSDRDGSVTVTVAENTYAEVTFAYWIAGTGSAAGTSQWQRLGTDDAGPYRIFHDVRDFAPGTIIEYRAVVRDASGNLAAASTTGVVT